MTFTSNARVHRQLYMGIWINGTYRLEEQLLDIALLELQRHKAQ